MGSKKLSSEKAEFLTLCNQREIHRFHDVYYSLKSVAFIALVLQAHRNKIHNYRGVFSRREPERKKVSSMRIFLCVKSRLYLPPL
jgi:hypothetical protein